MSNRDEQADLAKLADAFFQNLEYDPACEYGSIGTDCKRPFGNSDVERDILEIICWEPEGDDGSGSGDGGGTMYLPCLSG